MAFSSLKGLDLGTESKSSLEKGFLEALVILPESIILVVALITDTCYSFLSNRAVITLALASTGEEPLRRRRGTVEKSCLAANLPEGYSKGKPRVIPGAAVP